MRTALAEKLHAIGSALRNARMGPKTIGSSTMCDLLYDERGLPK